MTASSMLAAALVFLGAGLGALLRWGLAVWWNAAPPGWPWGTLAANLLGGMVVGLLMGTLDQAQAAGWSEETIRAWRLFAVTGFLGGLTTFSTFSAEVVALVLASRWMEAAAWAGLHLAGSLALAGLGWWLGAQAWLGWVSGARLH